MYINIYELTSHTNFIKIYMHFNIYFIYIGKFLGTSEYGESTAFNGNHSIA